MSEPCAAEAKQTIFHRMTQLLMNVSGAQRTVALLSCLGGLCAPLCASHQSAPVPFPRLNTVSYPSTLTLYQPKVKYS